MKTLLRNLAAGAAVTLALAYGASTVHGQVQDLRFTTGFSFVAGGVAMPAGTYTVHRSGSSPAVVLLSNADTRKGALLQVRSDDLPKETPYENGVKFEMRDGRYVLTTLWDSPIGPASATPLLK